MNGCCNEAGCTRDKPILLSRGGLSGAWYVVTDYHEDGEGRICSNAKHELTTEQSAQLTKAFEALNATS